MKINVWDVWAFICGVGIILSVFINIEPWNFLFIGGGSSYLIIDSIFETIKENKIGE